MKLSIIRLFHITSLVQIIFLVKSSRIKLNQFSANIQDSGGDVGAISFFKSK